VSLIYNNIENRLIPLTKARRKTTNKELRYAEQQENNLNGTNDSDDARSFVENYDKANYFLRPRIGTAKQPT